MSLENALYVVQLIMPKIIFCNESSIDIVLKAIKERNCNSTVVVFGKHISALSFSDILKNCNDAEVANFRYAELDDIKKTACILHSSGTTGLPKGVEISNYSVIIFIQQVTLYNTKVPALWFSSLYWMSGIMMNFNSITCCSVMLLYPTFDEETLCQLIEKYKVMLYYI